MVEISPSEITPEHLYLNRRKFMVGAGSAATLMALAACGAPEPAAPCTRCCSYIPLNELPPALGNAEPFASSDYG